MVVEKVDCFSVMSEKRAGNRMVRGRWVASMERSKWLWRRRSLPQ